MSLANIAMNQILEMFIIIFIGVICFKTKLIDEATNKKLSNILLLLVNPLIIFVSYQQEFSSKLLNG
jgi:predicted permease